MTGSDWILCERRQQWAAALRLALARGETRTPPRRFYETRTLPGTLTQLLDWPHSLVLVEVHRANLAEALDWLAATTPRFPSARFVALLDGDLISLAAATSPTAGNNLTEIRDILCEAGVSVTSMSSRRLRDIFTLADRHATQFAQPATPLPDQSLEAWAWSLLPWQDA